MTLAIQHQLARGSLLRMLTETIASGMGSRPNDNVQKVTGAPPIKFADFAPANRAGVDIDGGPS
jgi:hypothetical protein